ncbi:MAG TPA: flippase activity-associated protein Agl23 [Chthoniobacterales bacterium]
MEFVAAGHVLSKENPVPSARLPRWVPWTTLLVAAFFRIAWLDIKPAHFDEGINGWFVDQMTKNGFYEYDPTNYHGPLHFYVEFVSLTIFGRNLWALRMPVVLVGLLTVWLAWGFRRHFGDRAAAIGAAGLAISPGFVFYQRYAIHETWLVLFLMLLAWGVMEMVSFGTRRGLAAVVLGVTGCILTKETYLIHFIGGGLAWGAYWLWQKARPVTPEWRKVPQHWSRERLCKYLALAVFALVFFYSGNFFDWHGVQGIVTTFFTWVHTGVDSAGHMKKEQQIGPFNYYWLWLGWKFEPLMLVGVAASLATLWRATGPARWLALYALACLCGYSIIAYKTPWCVISIAWPFYILGGIGLDWLLRLRWTIPATLAIVLGASFSVARTIELNFKRFDDDSLPYVYVQTYRDVEWVLKPIRSLLRRDPTQYAMNGKIHLDSYYPLPWYLGDLTNVHFPKPGAYQTNMDCEFLICDASRVDELTAHLEEAYYRVDFRLRSGQDPCVALLNAAVFGPEFGNREPDIQAKETEKVTE